MENKIAQVIENVNNAIKQILCGNYVAFCGYMYTIPQQLLALKKAITEEREKYETEIKNLRRILDDLNGGTEDGAK